ncbi:TIGR02391 family protein [Modestobacter sp. VKM Ac-2986]|uniref:TIGR02391 family protein n=1 Tax=Modestobacter sp. VKM Ac-2986 TaxID=3004140 RepID=UPI0022AAA605|nr:TIGR02391 family protein [Modestobacter sp. VKM Ac-2986]MCZ2827735.1 TIGR02391 family protein [Modestobacter sp. VKM Ac-2986]
MAGLNAEWALGELRQFLWLSEFNNPNNSTVISGRRSNLNSHEMIAEQAQVVELIFAQVLPRWREDVPSDRNKTVNRWTQHREAASRALAAIQRQEEIRANLGDDAPDLSAASMHAWVWDGARSLWSTGHYRDAVGAAARRVNAEVQNKVGRRDLSEAKLFQSVFSPNPGSATEPRLRIIPDDGGATYKNVHRGALMIADGWFAAVRNPVAHDVGELGENEALEQLAALSMLARWADSATIER